MLDAIPTASFLVTLSRNGKAAAARLVAVATKIAVVIKLDTNIKLINIKLFQIINFINIETIIYLKIIFVCQIIDIY